MAGLTAPVIMMMIVTVAAQVLSIFMLPLSKGMTQIWPTIGAILSFLVAIFLMARMIHAGVNLSLLMPILAATVPVAGILLGVFIFGEAASLATVGTLIVACALIGVANLV